MKVNVKLMSIFAKYDKSAPDGRIDMKDNGTVRDLAEQLAAHLGCEIRDI